MSILDIFIIVPLLWGAHTGYQKGFLMTFLSLISFFLALVLGFKFYHLVMQAIASSVDVSGGFLSIIAFVITFGLIWFGINKLGNSLKGVLDSTLLGSFDNLIGAGVGALKFAFFVSLFLWLFSSVNILEKKTTDESLLYKFVQPVGPYVISNSSKIILVGEDVLEETKKVIQGKDKAKQEENKAPTE